MTQIPHPIILSIRQITENWWFVHGKLLFVCDRVSILHKLWKLTISLLTYTLFSLPFSGLYHSQKIHEIPELDNFPRPTLTLSFTNNFLIIVPFSPMPLKPRNAGVGPAFWITYTEYHHLISLPQAELEVHPLLLHTCTNFPVFLFLAPAEIEFILFIFTYKSLATPRAMDLTVW